MNTIRLSHRWIWPLLLGAAGIAAFMFRDTLWPRAVSYEEARTVVNRRCVECHSEKPTNRAFPFPAKGVKLDTAAQMKQHAQQIEASVVVERSMPLANLSNMTDEERWVLGRWVKTGAQVP